MKRLGKVILILHVAEGKTKKMAEASVINWHHRLFYFTLLPFYAFTSDDIFIRFVIVIAVFVFFLYVVYACVFTYDS